MRVPDIETAEKLLREAEQMNPGPWIRHSRLAGDCARKIALHCTGIDPDAAAVMGLLHDIGRRYGVTDMRHILDGYRFLDSLGYADCARICLTHSFQFQDIRSYPGQADLSEEELAFLKEQLAEITYDDYDRLIQLCDALAFPDGVTLIEKRLVDVTIRRGCGPFTPEKWREIFRLKDDFEQRTGQNLYRLLGVENKLY